MDLKLIFASPFSFSCSKQAERDLGADEGAEKGRALRPLRDQGAVYFRAANGQAENHLQGSRDKPC